MFPSLDTVHLSACIPLAKTGGHGFYRQQFSENTKTVLHHSPKRTPTLPVTFRNFSTHLAVHCAAHTPQAVHIKVALKITIGRCALCWSRELDMQGCQIVLGGACSMQHRTPSVCHPPSLYAFFKAAIFVKTAFLAHCNDLASTHHLTCSSFPLMVLLRISSTHSLKQRSTRLLYILRLAKTRAGQRNHWMCAVCLSDSTMHGSRIDQKRNAHLSLTCMCSSAADKAFLASSGISPTALSMGKFMVLERLGRQSLNSLLPAVMQLGWDDAGPMTHTCWQGQAARK